MKVPFHSKDPRVAPFLQAVYRAAGETGILPEHAALVISHFAEHFVTTVSMGRAFMWPGVGLWCPVRYVPKKKGCEAYAAVRFAPSRTFRADTRATCTAHPVVEEVFWAYAKRHRLSTYPLKDTSRAFVFQKMFRERIQSKMEDMGIDVEALLSRFVKVEDERKGGSKLK